jgi:hypothetical protein
VTRFINLYVITTHSDVTTTNTQQEALYVMSAYSWNVGKPFSKHSMVIPYTSFEIVNSNLPAILGKDFRGFPQSIQAMGG